jgi:hypothetical protein
MLLSLCERSSSALQLSQAPPCAASAVVLLSLTPLCAACAIDLSQETPAATVDATAACAIVSCRRRRCGRCELLLCSRGKYPIVPWCTPPRSACFIELCRRRHWAAQATDMPSSTCLLSGMCYRYIAAPPLRGTVRRRCAALLWRALSDYRGRRRGQRELFLGYRCRRFERHELPNHRRRRRGRCELSLR